VAQAAVVGVLGVALLVAALTVPTVLVLNI
jgi:hypothetical protein